MLRGSNGVPADLLLAFTDGRTTGGTHSTIAHAKRAGVWAVVITVASVKQTLRARKMASPCAHGRK
jgi:hypothetical protein